MMLSGRGGCSGHNRASARWRGVAPVWGDLRGPRQRESLAERRRSGV